MTSTSPRTVLIVEDEQAVARYLAAQLAQYNYATQILGATTGLREALASVSPSFLIMDVGFPEGDTAGPEAVSRLRVEGVTLPPVVFLSARDDIESRLAAVRAGGDAYLVKPVESSRLADTLDALAVDVRPEPYYVLVVEDSPSQAMFYARILEADGMVVRTETDPLKVLDVLCEFPAELILMDVYMPGCSGIELAAVLRQQSKFLSVPIVFLSAETDIAKHHAAFRTGGDDFLVKPIVPEFLVSSVRTRADRYRALRSMMVRDSLTGLLNHTSFTQHLTKDEARCVRQGSPLSVAMIDIDHFKQVNDRYGHPVGDQVIRSLSRLLQQRLRRSDVVGRYGGEEFAVAMPDTPPETAFKVLEAARAAFAQIVHHGADSEFSSSFSCGMTALDINRTAGSLIDAADAALYQAKRSGRNRVVIG